MAVPGQDAVSVAYLEGTRASEDGPDERGRGPKARPDVERAASPRGRRQGRLECRRSCGEGHHKSITVSGAPARAREQIGPESHPLRLGPDRSRSARNGLPPSAGARAGIHADPPPSAAISSPALFCAPRSAPRWTATPTAVHPTVRLPPDGSAPPRPLRSVRFFLLPPASVLRPKLPPSHAVSRPPAPAADPRPHASLDPSATLHTLLAHNGHAMSIANYSP